MKYPYTAIQLINSKIKVVCNDREKPNVFIDNIFKITVYNEWAKNQEVFEFANSHEESKIMRCIGGMNPQIIYGLEVTCIEIKSFFDDENKQHSFAYFKEENNKMKKTAMTIALDYLGLRVVITDKFKTEMLELEKKQIIEAYDDANTELTNDDGSFITGEQYYTTKFNK